MVVIVVYIMYSVLEGFVLMWFLKMTVVMLLILIMSPGVVVGDGFSVTFENPNPCALRGSSVEFRCSYEYPDGEVVNKTSWSKGATKDGRWTRTELSSLPSYQSRVEYLGDQQHNCSLAIYDLQDNDTGYYYFRFDTHDYGWRSKGSVYLSLAEPTASVYPESVRAGGNVTLTCKTSCTLPATIVWFRDGQPVDKAEFQARAEDAGNYSCAVEGQESVRSDPVALDVLYPPVSVLVEASAPGSLAEGSSVNLSCSSAANPAADSYTWFRRTGSPGSSSLLQVGSGQMLSLPSLEPSHTGHYLCQARNPLGENNSTELLLLVEMTETDRLIILVGIGVKVFAVLVLPVVMAWAWRKDSAADKEESSPTYESISGSKCYGQDSRVIEEETTV